MKEHLGARLDAYLAGSLEEMDRKNVEHHLQSCLACKQELKSIKDLAERVEQTRPEGLPQSAFKRYWQQLLGRHKEVKTMTAIYRLKRVVESNIHSAIDAMEEPSKMIKQLLREMAGAIKGAREEVIEAVVLQKGLEHRYREATTNTKKWEDRSALALKSGREDLAREALKEQMLLEGLADDFKVDYEKQTCRVDQLKGALSKLEKQFEDLRRRKGLWLSQAQSTIGKPKSQRAYQTAYDELARMLDVTRERTVVETSYREIYATEALEETIDAMDEGQVLEQRLVALKQRIQK